MKKHVILFGAVTLIGTGAAFALSGGSPKAGDKAFGEESCPPECCTATPAKPAPNACCYAPSCCK